MNRDPSLLLICGGAGIVGCIVLIIGNVIGSIVVPNYDWVADTISDLAAGRYEDIQDFAIYGYAGALMACAIGAAHFHSGSRRWSGGILCLILLAFDVAVIAARDEYGDKDSGGYVIHPYLVYVLGVLFALTMYLMARDMGRIRRRYRTVSLWCCGVWAVGAPIYYAVPTGVDGLWERGLGMVSIVWVVMLSTLLLKAGRDDPGTDRLAAGRRREPRSDALGQPSQICTKTEAP